MGKVEFWIASEPKGKVYSDLLDFCRSRSSRASVVIHKGARPSKDVFDFIEECKEFIVDERQQSNWPGGGTLRGTETVIYFSVCDKFIDKLKKSSLSLYDWVHPFLPEDLAFYDNEGNVILATIGHEQAAFVILNDTERKSLKTAIPHLQLTTTSPI
jgi:hypothetical protein